jgi:hypothetical protein
MTHLLICMCNLPATSHKAPGGRDCLLTHVSLVPSTGSETWEGEGGRKEGRMNERALLALKDL